MAGHQAHKGATVYGAGGAKVGMIRACAARDGYLVVRTGWLFGPDLHIPLGSVHEIDAAGNVHLGLHTNEMTNAERTMGAVRGDRVVSAEMEG